MIITRIEYQTLVLAFEVAKGMAPPYLPNLIAPYNPTWLFSSANSGADCTLT